MQTKSRKSVIGSDNQEQGTCKGGEEVPEGTGMCTDLESTRMERKSIRSGHMLGQGLHSHPIAPRPQPRLRRSKRGTRPLFFAE